MKPGMPAGETASDRAPPCTGAPSLPLPTGGGGECIGEKFAARQVIPTGSMSVPTATRLAHSDLGPQLPLSDDSGAREPIRLRLESFPFLNHPEDRHGRTAMKHMYALFGLILAGASALCGISASVNADDGAAIPAAECVERPKGVEPPPKRMAPTPLPRRGKEYSKGEVGAETSNLRIKAVCPNGRVPVIKALSTKLEKGNPLLGPDPGGETLRLEGPQRGEFIRRHLRSFEEVYKRAKPEQEAPPPGPPPGPPPQCDGVPSFGSCYYYGSAAFSTTADGGGMTQSIEKPEYVNTGGIGHTLDELAVQGGDQNGNIIEIGWFTSAEQYGNTNPHIFVFHWKNWNPTCYDTCGWVQWSNTYHPGMDLGAAVGKQVYIGYVFYRGNWWAWFDNQWMGYFPGSEWDGKYTKASLIQWFGEVASANGIPPKTDMGNGQFPNSPGAASMATLCDVDAKAWVCWYRDQQSMSRTMPKYYDIDHVSFGATRYGGSGD